VQNYSSDIDKRLTVIKEGINFTKRYSILWTRRFAIIKILDWGFSSAVEHLPSMHKVLAWSSALQNKWMNK
jgi:hypothetical protein